MNKFVQQCKTQLQKTPHGVLYAMCAGALIGVGFPFPFLWPCVFAGIALFYIGSMRAEHVWSAAGRGYLAGIVFALVVCAPIFLGVLPLNWFGINDPNIQIAAAVVLWFCAALLIGVFFGVCALVLNKVQTNSWFDVLLVPGLWVLFEWGSSFLFSAGLWGNGSIFGPHMTIWYVGYLAANDSVLLQISALGGVYALSFVIVLLGVLLARLVLARGHPQERRTYYIVIASILAVILLLHGAFAMRATFHQIDTSKDGTYIGIVSRYMPPTLIQSEAFQAAQIDAMSDLISPLREVEILILPENTAYLRTLDGPDSGKTLALFRKIGRGGTVPLVIDSEDMRVTDGALHEQAVFFKSMREQSYTEKQFLLPLGEYVPKLFVPLIRFFGGVKLLQQIELVRAHEPGMEALYAIPHGLTLAVRFCDELMSPELYRSQVRDGADLLVNVSSLSWFHGSPIVFLYMEHMAKVRAVESGRWLAQSSNMSPAYVVDDHGTVIAQTPWYKAESLKVYVHAKTGITLYTRFGFRIMLVLLLVIVLVRGLFLFKKYPAADSN